MTKNDTPQTKLEKMVEQVKEIGKRVNKARTKQIVSGDRNNEMTELETKDHQHVPTYLHIQK